MSHLQLAEDKGDGGRRQWEKGMQWIAKKYILLLVFYSVLVLGTEPRAFTCWANSLSLSYVPGPKKTSKYVILKTTTQRNSNYR